MGVQAGTRAFRIDRRGRARVRHLYWQDLVVAVAGMVGAALLLFASAFVFAFVAGLR